MKVLSLFDGISCGRVALERIGVKVDCYDAFEIDKYAVQVSEKNYPDIVHHGDVFSSTFEEFKGYDLLIGGSPCQSLSIVQSKTRQHLDGKSKLFFEYVRALETVKPKWFLFENVASMNEESKQVITDLLGVPPIFVDSADFSAQSRPRLYWTNIPVDTLWAKSELVLGDVLQPASEVDEGFWYKEGFDFLGLDKVVCATMHLNGHDILKRVNSPLHKCQTLTTCGGGNTQKKVYQDGRARKLTPLEYERLQTLPDRYTEGISNTRRYTAIGNGWTVDVIAHLLKGIAPTT